MSEGRSWLYVSALAERNGENLYMAKIHELEPHVANLIAAGEVVERPGSVIKELIENSIDAGAGSVTVEITGGGMTYMRVSDNGCGISPEDVETAFLRHATSKLRDASGLESISTLGFRGEALAAIASVSRIDLLTREKGAPEGTSLSLEGGKILEKSTAGCPDGTTIIVRDLFFNTPARLKFMKSDRAEGANISTIVLRCALSHPEVSIRFIKDGKEEFHTPGDGKAESCIYSLLGRDFFKGLLKAQAADDDVAVTGFVSSPAYARGNRANQFFFVNGRYIQSKTLQAALEQAYRNSLFTGKFPSCVLYITMSWSAVDVNVHPSKIEVKFLKEKQVFDGVYYAALSALEGEKEKAEIEISKCTRNLLERNVPERESAQRSESFAAKKEGKSISAQSGSVWKSGYSGTLEYAPPVVSKISEREQPAAFHDSIRSGGQMNIALPKPVSSRTNPEHVQSPKPASEIIPVQKASASPVPEVSSENAPETVPDMDFRMIGEAMGTYIVVEKDGSLFLIDKHAAHERILFDKLRSQGYELMSQRLLVPLVLEPGREESVILAENQDMLDSLGFEVEPFGDNAVVVRQVPSMIELSDAEILLAEICERIKVGQKTGPEAMWDEILHTVACKAAIKAGKSSPPEELMSLVGRVLSGEIKYCPHGRPVAMEITKTTIDRNFKRIN